MCKQMRSKRLPAEERLLAMCQQRTPIDKTRIDSKRFRAVCERQRRTLSTFASPSSDRRTSTPCSGGRCATDLPKKSFGNSLLLKFRCSRASGRISFLLFLQRRVQHRNAARAALPAFGCHLQLICFATRQRWPKPRPGTRRVVFSWWNFRRSRKSGFLRTLHTSAAEFRRTWKSVSRVLIFEKTQPHSVHALRQVAGRRALGLQWRCALAESSGDQRRLPFFAPAYTCLPSA